MGLLQGLLKPRPEISCHGKMTYLRNPQIDDFGQWRDLRRQSRSFIEPWEPLWLDDELLFTSFRNRMNNYSKLVRDDHAFPFFIFSRDEKQLLGAITISNLRRGVAQMATLGYWIGEPFANKGFMTDALAATIDFAGEDLKLHRLEAACLPANEPSMRLLQKSGFTREGLAKDYLKINGQWEDHVLWGLSLAEQR